MINIDITQYQTLVFDCDGVILNSNKIKTQAFYEATKHFGIEAAQSLVNYHLQNGGISRYAKFEYFFTEILNRKIEPNLLDDLLIRFAQAVKKGLMSCEVTEGLVQLREKTKYAKWLIVSGGDQNELQEVFLTRGLSQYFDGGIFGSPDAKESILMREVSNTNITMPSLFFGDSKYDYQVAKHAGLDFLFLSKWTEVKDWTEWSTMYSIAHKPSLSDLVTL
jgi:phosphoglycolate phosphatase-like HAD superfamily hydrolase